MKLSELLKYRRIDALSKGYDMKGRKWRVIRTQRYDENGNVVVHMTANDSSLMHLLWFDASVDVNENVMSSTGLKTLDLRL